MFKFSFQITKKVIFQVSFDDLGGANDRPYFSTSACVFNQPKTDFIRCGQCQEDVLIGQSLEFFKKWDKFHLADLTEEEEIEVLNDIEKLKNTYNWINGENFHEQRELSKQKLKTKKGV